MNILLHPLIKPNTTVAVALSGGSDSMALLHYMLANANKFAFSVVAINVEHGIRGESSLNDSNFVKDYCKKLSVPLFSYSVDSLEFAKEQKISIEQAARILRYGCFNDALSSKKCDLVATAHHLRDNVESVLLNLCRGTGLKGVSGINDNFDDKIIRPFLSVKKEEIDQYIIDNSIPYVTDESNLSTDYTRNFIRLEVLPKLKQVFPEAEKNIGKFTEIAKAEDDYLDKIALSHLITSFDRAEILIPIDKVIFNRCTIMALKSLGIEKDWEKVHIDNCFNLISSENGCSINLPKGITAIKEYEKIVFFRQVSFDTVLPFRIGSFSFCDATYRIQEIITPVDLKDGLYLDGNKIPKNAVIRTKRAGDIFTKFGGGTKNLGDYFTDLKIPLRMRDSIPLIALDNKVLAIFGVAISNDVKIDDQTLRILKLI